MHRPQIRFRLRRVLLLLCACTLLITVWPGSFTGRSHSVARATDVQQLVQTGVDYYQAGDFLAAVEPWLTAYGVYETTQDFSALAIVSENLARTYQQIGQTSEEIFYWEKAIAATQALGDRPKLGRLIAEQAQAYSRLGEHRRAIALLCGDTTENNAETCQPNSALQIAETAKDITGQVTALGSLGEAYRLSGDSDKAREILNRGLDRSRELEDVTLQSAVLNSLGNTLASLAEVSYRRASEAKAQEDTEATSSLQKKADNYNDEAIASFEASYQLALAQSWVLAEMRSLLSLIPAYERAADLVAAQGRWQLALAALSQLPNSQVKAFAAIKLADFLEPLASRSSQILLNAKPPEPDVAAQSTNLLNQALAIGKAIENPQVVAFALGKLGNLDERAGHYAMALERTQQAQLAAEQDLGTQESLYLWEWQRGRILFAQGNLTDATDAYRQAVDSLEQIRSDILNTSQDLQFDFRNTVEPIYRQYAQLKLKTVPGGVKLTKGEPAFNELDTTLVTLDSLKVAELQSYFANDCVIAPVTTRVDAVGDSEATAILSTAILAANGQLSDPNDSESKQLAVIISLPDGSKKVAQTLTSPQQIEAEIKTFRYTLESGGSQSIGEYNYAPSQQLYDWLIRPFERDLTEIKMLVFVNDGLLRSVPMAALYDSQQKQYLIERFAVATTPSLTLTNPQRVPRPTSLSALLMGVSKETTTEGERFKKLPAVEQELMRIAAAFSDSKTLLNEDFSLSALKAALAKKEYRILHMATHGTFGFDPADNFVVMGAKQKGEASEFNETLTISKLDELIRGVNDPTRKPVELLTLTACETAVGGDRSTLGLAGVAVRAGVRKCDRHIIRRLLALSSCC